LLTACSPNYKESIYFIDGKLQQPVIGVRSVKTLTVGKWQFKDSNNNGKLDPYEDWRLSPAKRAADLVPQLSTDQQIGLLGEYMWGGFAAGGIAPKTEEAELGTHEVEAIVKEFSRFTIMRWPGETISATAIARKTNKIQALAESEPFGIPVLITTDPIFSAANNMESTALAHQNMAPQIPDWPLVLGLGAINDPDYVKEIGRMHAAQLRALGIHWMLGPQIDFATEPMWSRVYDTFGSLHERVVKLGTAYIQGLQGKEQGVNPFTGIVVTLKHFPGGGANQGGMDSHSATGKYNVYPGNNLEEHIAIMKEVIQAAKPLSIMPNYSIFKDVSYKGKQIEQVSSHYSLVFMQDILRKEIGWDGMVTSDWSAVSLNKDDGTAGTAWGTEHWTNGERIKRYVECGGHQIGMAASPAPVWKAGLSEGTIKPTDIAQAAQKVLEVTFASGLFENPYVDENKAQELVTRFIPQAHEAMMRSFTLLKNEAAILPFDTETTDQNKDGKISIYYDGLDDRAIDAYTARVQGFNTTTDITKADYAIIRVSARHGYYFGFDGGVPLSYKDPIMVYDYEKNKPSSTPSTASSRGFTAEANNEAALKIAETIEKAILAKQKNPQLKLILVVSMYRPFIISDYINSIDVLAADFGMTDQALLDMLFQMRNGIPDKSIQPRGTLPMEIPSSQEAVYNSKEDLPNDSADPTFPAGFGITKY
jgi:beta-glucosidase